MSIGEKRLLAAIFDYTTIVFVGDRLAFVLSFGNNEGIIHDWVGLGIAMVLYIYKDSLFKSGSLGKKIFGLAIYDKKTNKYASNEIKIKRNKAFFEDFPSIAFKMEKNPVRHCDAKYGTKIDYIKK